MELNKKDLEDLFKDFVPSQDEKESFGIKDIQFMIPMHFGWPIFKVTQQIAHYVFHLSVTEIEKHLIPK